RVLLAQRGDDVVPGGGRGGVGVDELDRDLLLAQLGGERVHRLGAGGGVHVDAEDGHALAGQAARHGGAHPAGGAEDDGPLAGAWVRSGGGTGGRFGGHEVLRWSRVTPVAPPSGSRTRTVTARRWAAASASSAAAASGPPSA